MKLVVLEMDVVRVVFERRTSERPPSDRCSACSTTMLGPLGGLAHRGMVVVFIRRTRPLAVSLRWT